LSLLDVNRSHFPERWAKFLSWNLRQSCARPPKQLSEDASERKSNRNQQVQIQEHTMLSTLRDYEDKNLLTAIRGTNVYGTEDTKLGSVEDAIVDSDSGELQYLIVKAGWIDSRRFLVPADQVYAYGENDDDLYVSLSKRDAETLPEFQDQRLASDQVFTSYQRDYQSAWRTPTQASGLRTSPRLLQFKDRIHNAFSRRDVTTRREPATSTYGSASYSGPTTHPTGVYGVYSDRKDVEKTITALRERGIASSDISVVFPNPDMSKEFAVQKNTKAPEGALAGGGTGLLIGGTLGWLAGIGTLAIPGIGPLLAAGPIVAAIAGAGVGSAIGGIAGALIGLGLPELEAKRYEEAIKKGRILVSVHCPDMRHAENARKVLDDSGAKEVFLSGERKAA
jgi:sporulation protein YlmC with PRC-barrel domain